MAIEHIRLECTTGTSNKFYTLNLIEALDGSWRVEGSYGALGTNGSKTRVAGFDRLLDKQTAEAAMARFANKKLAKGYRIVSGALPTVAPAPRYAIEFIAGKGGFRAAKSYLAASLDNADVARGLADIKTPRTLTEDTLALGTPAFAVSLALALAGILRLSYQGATMEPHILRVAVRDMIPKHLALLRALGLTPPLVESYADAIGGGAIGLVL